MRISGCVQVLLIGASLLAGCTGATPGGPTPPTDVTERAPSRTLVMVVKREPVNLSPKLKQETSLTATKRLFNAGLALIGDGSAPKPYLAEALPELRTDSWRVFPDGRMETTYKLRSALQWQDGGPFSAEDFVFAWRVYTTPGVDVTLQTPQDRIEEVVAPEPSTVLIRWARLYPEAGRLSYGDFPPLPRHLLERSFREDPIETFLAQTYWTRDYIGVGPYRLERWEPGTFVEGTAFSGHALGAPRIDRIQVLFIPDENTGLAQLLSGAAHVAFAGGISLEQAIVLQREWGAGQVEPLGFAPAIPYSGRCSSDPSS